jgi:hypothetical protein
MSQLALSDTIESPADSFVPDEVAEESGYVISIYRPQERHFNEWLRDLDEMVMDMTGYSVHDFAVVPTFGGWSDWPNDPYDAALAVLRQDVWGQSFLGDLDLE